MSRLSRRRFIQLTGAAGAAGVLIDAQPMAAAGAVRRSGDAVVELRQGTNLAAAISPAGDRLIVEVQGILWHLPRSGGRARALTHGRSNPPARTGRATVQP
jgi:hypothetical protein